MVARVVPWTSHSHIPNKLPLRLKLNTHTQLKTENAIMLMMVLSEHLATLMFNLILPKRSWQHSNMDQSQLQLKLINQLSNPTVVVFSMLIVELTLITVFSLLATSTNPMDNPTGSSRIHGELAGDYLVTSTLLIKLDQVSAVSTWLLSGPLPTEFDDQYLTT
jgi:hypothetical protein